ncbi:MAG: tetratricopeptide repeat protein [Acidiferrobacterales bacterium]
MASPIDQEFIRQAMSHIKAGRLPEARDLFRHICEQSGRDPWAWTMLGTLHSNLGSIDEAIACFRKATDVDPRYPQALYMLGNAFRLKGDLKESAGYLKKALEASPGHLDAWVMMSWLNIQLDDLGLAESNARQALVIDRNFPKAHFALASAMKAQMRVADAIDSYRRAVALEPRFAEAHLELGNLLESSGRLAEAATSFQAVIRLTPGNDRARLKLAMTLHRLGQLQEAIVQYQGVLKSRPDNAPTLGNLSNAYRSQGALDEAEQLQRRALQLDPGVPEGHNNLGNILKSKGRVSEAISCYRRAMELDPGFAGAHSNLLLCLNYLTDCSSESILEEHKKWAQMFSLPAGSRHPNDIDPERTLRIGYVSADLRTHAVAYFIEPLLKHHDPGLFEVICYAEVMRPDNVTERMKGYAQKWRDTCVWTDAQLTDAIRADAVDILVDLSGHTADSRLRVFTAKPAPVQVSYIGYANTSGLPTIDYRFSDEIADPPADQQFYTEKLVYLDTGFSCYSPPEHSPEVSPLPSSRAGYVTFASMGNLFKINDNVLDLWCQILHANPASRMRLFRHVLKGSAKEELRQAFAKRGIGYDRIDLWNEIPRKYAHLQTGLQHLGFYEEIDITLDTFPWNGHTISCESLWMGVPVVTLSGTRHAGRIGASILNAVGLPWLVASNSDDYVNLATRLANDAAELARLRGSLRERMRTSPLCDGRKFARAVENAYRDMWRNWCATTATGS